MHYLTPVSLLGSSEVNRSKLGRIIFILATPVMVAKNAKHIFWKDHHHRIDIGDCDDFESRGTYEVTVLCIVERSSL